MDDHRAEYLEAREEFKSFVSDTIKMLAGHDPGFSTLLPKEVIFRINRDIRFSKNKDPYKTNFGAFFNPGGKKSNTAGFYMHVQPGESFIGGGIYMPPADILKKIRQEIDYNADELIKIVEAPLFRDTYGEINGERLKTAPKGYPKDHPHISWLQLKSFVASAPVKDGDLKSDDLNKNVENYYLALRPLIGFLNTALD